jgi:hypothetical protein
MSRWTVVPQNVTRRPRISYMVPMDAGAAAAQVLNMQNRNMPMYMNSGEKMVVDKADDAMFKASEAEYMANDLSFKFTEIIRSEAFIYSSIAIIVIALILVYRLVM